MSSAILSRIDILAFLEAVMRVYNQSGRRDNIYKARIKILVNALGAEEMRRQIEREFVEIKAGGTLEVPADEIARITDYFAPPEFETLSDVSPEFETARNADAEFPRMVGDQSFSASRCRLFHRDDFAQTHRRRARRFQPTNSSMRWPTLWTSSALREIRVSHEQNLVLPHVRKKDLPAVFARLAELGLATANAGLVTDIIACPGLDYCDLANARSIPIAQRISDRFADLKRQRDIGELKIKISGCINACGHHHAGHIGILGVDKKGVEFYQLSWAVPARKTPPSAKSSEPDLAKTKSSMRWKRVVDIYLEKREGSERFLDTVRRIGLEPFKERAYAGWAFHI